jgi:uncharacterized protein (TIGR04255 family)
MAGAKSKYPNPPIQEAICEVHFDLSDPLALPRMELLKAVWASEYSEQRWVSERNVKFQISPEGIQTQDRNLGQRLICKTTDGRRLVQLSGLFLAVNQLKPYPGWEESFRDTVLLRAKELQKTVGPLRFKRVGLRYINRVDFPQVPLVWEDWFELKLPTPDLPEARQREFQMQFHYELPASRRLIVNVAALGSPDGKVSPVILDLDLVWEGTPREPAELRQTLELVHGPHKLAFEAYLNDTTRKLFY